MCHTVLNISGIDCGCRTPCLRATPWSEFPVLIYSGSIVGDVGLVVVTADGRIRDTVVAAV